MFKNNLIWRYCHNANGLEQLLITMIVLAYGVRAWQIWRYNPMQHLWSDPLRHWTQASETLQSGPMAFFDPVGYQLWLSVVQKITLGLPELVAVYAIALSFLTPWLWYRALRETVASKMLGLLGWAALAWSPSWIAIFSYFMTETLFLPLLGLSLWLTCRAERKKSDAALYLAVLAWSLTIMTRGIAAPMAGAALLLVWIKCPNKIKLAIGSLLLITLLFLPLAYRNHHAVGMWSPLGNAWLTRVYAVSGKSQIHLNLQRGGAAWFYGYSSPSMESKPFAPLSKWTSKRTGIVAVPADLNHGGQDWSAAFSINQAPDKAWLYWENIIYLMCEKSWPDDDPTQIIARAQTNQRWLWPPLFVLVLFWSLASWRQCAKRPVTIAVLTVWLIFQAGFLLAVNEGRYRKPAEGLVLVQLLLLIDNRYRVFRDIGT